MSTIAAFDGLPDGAGLPDELLQLLAELIPCDDIWVSGQDTPNWSFFVDQTLSGGRSSGDLSRAARQAYETYYWESDCSYADRTGALTSVLRSSDLQSDRARTSSPMYLEHDQPLGVERELRVILGTGRARRTVRIIFCRGPGCDFSDREVEMLTLLRPHLQQLWNRLEQARLGRAMTDRQRQILELVAEGRTNRQIATQLGISEGTVRKHLENAYSRLGVTNRAAAARAV